MKVIVGIILMFMLFVLAGGVQIEEEPFTLSSSIISEQRLQSLDEQKVKQTIDNIPDVFELVGIVDEKWAYLELDGLYYLYDGELIYIGDKMPPDYRL